MWPVGRGSKGGVSYLHSVPGMCLAADRAVPACMWTTWHIYCIYTNMQRGVFYCIYLMITLSLGIWVQRVVPAADSWTRPLLSIWKLPWQQSETERGVAVSPAHTRLCRVVVFCVGCFFFFFKVFCASFCDHIFVSESGHTSSDSNSWLALYFKETLLTSKRL